MYEFLMELSKELNAQDHRHTAMPYFVQIMTDKQVVACEGCGTEIWVNCDGDQLETEEEIKEYITESLVNELSLSDKDADLKYEEMVGEWEWKVEGWLESHDYRKVNVTTEQRYENAFLTVKACKQNIKCNRHHYNNPKTYIQSAFRNPELEKVMEFICSISGGKIYK